MSEPITEFKGDYKFLSNFYPVEVLYEGLHYPSVEHAYQAAKTPSILSREAIRMMATPALAKRAGQQVTRIEGWGDIREDVMLVLLKTKFENPELREKLLATGDSDLVEQNTWHDAFWGVCECKQCPPGQNKLGKLLMIVREGLR